MRGSGARAKAAPLQSCGSRRLLDTSDGEAFGFERRPDFGDLVALNFNDPVFYRAAGAAGRTQFFRHFLYDGSG